MKSTSPTSKQCTTKISRQIRALELRKTGATYRAIADDIGCSAKTAYNYVIEAIKEVNAANAESAADLINIESARLEGYLLKLQEKIDDGDLAAIDRAIRISESLRKLQGLDKPMKIASTDPEGKNPFSLLASAIIDNQVVE